MHKDLKMSLEILKDFQDDVPGIGNFPDRMLSKDYEEFISVLYDDINKIVIEMERNPELRHKDKEDRLTIEIKSSLCHFGYTAGHDNKIGGHCDLTVEKNEWLWIGEAKIFDSRGYTWVNEGFQQLTTRYSIGGYNNCHGAILIYILKPNTKQIMEKWKAHLLANNSDVDNIQAFDFLEKSLIFCSEHSHQRTGLPFKVRHIPLCLHFDPKK